MFALLHGSLALLNKEAVFLFIKHKFKPHSNSNQQPKSHFNQHSIMRELSDSKFHLLIAEMLTSRLGTVFKIFLFLLQKPLGCKFECHLGVQTN